MTITPIIEPSILAELWNKPFSHWVTKKPNDFSHAPAVSVPDFQSNSSPIDPGFNDLLDAEEAILRSRLDDLGGRDLRNSPLLLLERVPKLRFEEDASGAGLIVDLSGSWICGEDVEVLIQLLGVTGKRNAVYLDLSNTRPRNESLISATQLRNFSAHLPNLRCINLIGSNCITPRTIDEFYFVTSPTPPGAHSNLVDAPSVALIYKSHTGDPEMPFTSLISSAPPLATEGPRFSIAVRLPITSSRTYIVHVGASWPFLQLDSALEAIYNVAGYLANVRNFGGYRDDRSLGGDEEVDRFLEVIQSAMTSLGPGPGSAIIPTHEDAERLPGKISPSCFKESMRIFPPAIFDVANLKGWLILFDIEPDRCKTINYWNDIQERVEKGGLPGLRIIFG